MNKITRTVLGTAAAVALATAVTVAPASASGIYVNPGATPSTFLFNPGSSFSLLTPAKFISFGGGTTSGILTLIGSGFEAGTSSVFDNTTLFFAPKGGGSLKIETGKSALTFSAGSVSVTNFAPTTFSGSGSSGDYLNVTAPVVPEASTVVSFGALLALGGLAVLRRKSVKNAA